MALVKVHGIDLAYDVAGGDGPTIVVTHGSWGSRRGWSAVVPGLARSFQVVTWDRAGHGESADRPGQGTREQDADDLAGLIEALDVAPAHMVGNSFGGSITLELVTRRPDLFRSLIVHEPPVFDVLGGGDAPDIALARQRIEQVTERLARGDREGGARLFADTVVGSVGTWDSYSPETQAAMMRLSETFLDENRDPAVFALDLDRIAMFPKPALLSYGDASPGYFERVVRQVAGVMPDANAHCFAGAGHVPHRSDPDAFVDVVTAFLAGVE